MPIASGNPLAVRYGFMDFIADLHVHSRYSRATSRQMNLESLWVWAQRKGITVLGTGDFTHPRWFAELQEKLDPAEPGLYKLKNELCEPLLAEVPVSCRGQVRFMLSAEISTIYKKNDKTRKVHSLILSPDFLAAGRLNAALQEIGNISSDGRPILGLDTKLLLAETLEASPYNIFIPAHIWTPHFSVLGAFSGFNSIEECFEDLSGEIFALETGLSSDPAMNWRLSGLDRYVLVSNSDAHSPTKLAREANVFSCELSFTDMMHALRGKDRQKFKGTIEFFPEEGKYHFDGHRSCCVRLSPEETLKHEGRCPRCGRKVTVGVMHRVQDLSDRQNGFRPQEAFDFESLIPLEEIIAQLSGTGVTSKKVTMIYHALLRSFGSELYILRNCPLKDLYRAGYDTVADALYKVRRREVIIKPGYDGEYGTVTVLSHGKTSNKQLSLF